LSFVMFMNYDIWSGQYSSIETDNPMRNEADGQRDHLCPVWPNGRLHNSF
jgi:hypothetical protein